MCLLIYTTLFNCLITEARGAFVLSYYWMMPSQSTCQQEKMYKNDLLKLGIQKSLQVYFETTMEKQLLSKHRFRKVQNVFTLIKVKNINLNMQFTEEF